MTKIFVDYYKSPHIFIKYKKYTVKYITEDSYIVQDEDGFYQSHLISDKNFISINEWRDIQINKLFR